MDSLNNKCGNRNTSGYFPWYNDKTHNIGFNASSFAPFMNTFLNAIIDGQTLKIANCSGDMQDISNLNSISDGIYWINGYNSVTNKPYAEHFMLISVSNVGGQIIVQTALPIMSSGRKTRMYASSTWSEWFSN